MTIHPFARALGIFSFVLGSLTLQGCSNDDTEVPTITIDSIEVTPSNAHIANGSNRAFSAVAHLSDDTTQDVTQDVTWSSSSPGVATISDATGTKGVAHGASPGTATISATLQGVSGSTLLTVDALALARVEIHPLAPSIAKGTTQQFSVTAVMTDGTSHDVSNDATWSSSDDAVATVDQSGLAHAVSTGSAIITATYQDKADSTTLTVTNAVIQSISVSPATASIAKGTNRQFIATGHFSDDSVQDVTETALWSSSNGSIATVSNTAGSRGLAHGVNAGNAMISASIGTVGGNAALTVTSAVLSSVSVTPTNPSIAAGTTRQFTATANFSDGSTQNVTSSADWSSSDPAVASIDGSGLAHGNAAGTSTISATFQGTSGSTTLTVTPSPLTSIVIAPSNPSQGKGGNTQFTATATFADNSTQDVTNQTTWSSSNTSVATISNADGSRGLAHAVDVGTSTITGTFQTQSASTTLTVTTAVLDHIEIAPANPSVPKGNNQQFTATGVWTDNSTQDFTNTATWASSDTSVADVSNSAGSKGLAAALGVGTATITATAGGKTGSTVMTVTSATLTSIQVEPHDANQKLAKGFTLQFHAIGLFSDGSNSDVTDDVNWISTNPDAATISNAPDSKGLATGVNAGPTTIIARQGSKQGSASLTVTNATLNSINVTPSNASLPLGVQRQYTATGTFSDASTQDLTSQVSWISSDPTKASVSNDAGTQGLVAALEQGTSTITATHGGTGKTDSTPVTVTDAAISSITVTPQDATRPKGTKVQYRADGLFTDGHVEDVTTAVTWNSSRPAVATISNAGGNKGEATAVDVGTTTIRATDSATGTTATAKLTVTAAELSEIAVTPANGSFAKGVKKQYTATGTFTDATTQDLTSQVTWQSSDETVASISNAAGSKGRATMISEGNAVISATKDGVTGNTDVMVTAASLTKIDVTPANSSVAKGLTQQMTATGTYTDASTQDITNEVTWSSDHPEIADVSNAADSKGLVAARDLGTAHISAALDGKTGTTALTVTAATVQGLSITPTSGKIAKNYKLQYKAIAQLSDGSTQNVTATASWSTLNPSVATVSNTSGSKGLVTGVAAGATSVRATFNSFTSNAAVQVTNATLDSIEVTPANATIHANATLQYTATGTFSDASTLDLTRQVMWSSSNSTVADISNDPGSQGLATGGAVPGTTTIRATDPGSAKFDTTPLTNQVP